MYKNLKIREYIPFLCMNECITLQIHNELKLIPNIRLNHEQYVLLYDYSQNYRIIYDKKNLKAFDDS